MYAFEVWISSGSHVPGSVEIYLNGNKTIVGSVNAVNNGWPNYVKVPAGSAPMKAGSNVIEVFFPTGGLNFQAIEVTRTGDAEFPTEK